MLYQNEPNPFKTWTTISFDLPKSGEAKIVIRDLNGRILTEINREFERGNNQIRLDNVNLPNGILTYTLIQGSRMVTNRMIISK